MNRFIWCIGLVCMVFTANTQTLPATTSLFNGENFDGWKMVNGEYKALWTIQDSSIICGDGQQKIPKNTFLYTTQEYEDFEFFCLFKITGDPNTGMINSGIQYRSQVEDGRMIGYQADIGDGYWGDLYDEHRRGLLALADRRLLKKVLRVNDWNSYRIRCIGDRHELFINGVKTVDYIEQDQTIPRRGVISLQNHSGGNSKVEFRALQIIEY